MSAEEAAIYRDWKDRDRPGAQLTTLKQFLGIRGHDWGAGVKPGRQGSQRAGSARKCSQALRGEREGRRSVTRKRGTGRDRALGGGRRNGGKHLWEPGTGNRMTGASPSRKGGPEAGGRGVRTAQGEEGAHPAAARGRQGEGPHLEGSRTGARLRLRGAGSGSLRPGRSARRVCTARRNGVHISQARGA